MLLNSVLTVLKPQPEYSAVSLHLSDFNSKHNCLLLKPVNSQDINPNNHLKQQKLKEVTIMFRHVLNEFQLLAI